MANSNDDSSFDETISSDQGGEVKKEVINCEDLIL